MVCTETVCLDVLVRTTAGAVMLRRLECLVLDTEKPGFLLRHRTMQSLGIDVKRQMEQLAGGDRITELDGDGDLPAGTRINFNVKLSEMHENLERMLSEAESEGNDTVWAAKLRALVMRFENVWRVSVGPDPPANAEPTRVELGEAARPYRIGTRRYSPDQRQFLRDYVRELEQHGLVRRNNESRLASPELPVRNPGTDKFRFTVDVLATIPHLTLC
eukprot:jgi/Phyca11/131788/e_gw1.113.50.1